MTRTIALLAACALFAACVTTPASPDGQAGPVGPNGPDDHHECTANSESMVVVNYGDSSIKVTHKIHVKKNKNFKLRLNPANSSADPVNYTTMNVYVFGSTADAQWLNEVYNANGANQKDFTICADAPVGEYKYMVVIPGIGTIDPRIVIKDPD